MSEKNYKPKKEWFSAYKNMDSIAYPSEYVIRIFKGTYPKLKLNREQFKNKKICDLGCGDGRNLILLNECGFKLFGVEISEEIIKQTKNNLKQLGISPILKAGTNEKIPFKDSFFDYLLSWNSCYYMGKNSNFELHVKEMARVLKKNGYLVVSVPKKTCFIFKDSKKVGKNLMLIQNDPFKIRNGERLWIFKNQKELRDTFSKYFHNFVFASVEDDCFGYEYHWDLMVCQKS